MWDYSTSEVLTMEYCPGIKINRVAELDRLGIDRTRLARLSVESYLQQLVCPIHLIEAVKLCVRVTQCQCVTWH